MQYSVPESYRLFEQLEKYDRAVYHGCNKRIEKTAGSWTFDECESYIINSLGEKIKALPKYSDVGFKEGVAPISNNGKWQIIDLNGNVVASAKFKPFDFKPAGTKSYSFNLYQSSDGLFRFRIDDKYGFMNHNGDLVIKPNYDDAGDFVNGVAVAGKAGVYGLIDKNEQVVGDFKYDHISSYSKSYEDGLYKVKKQGKYGVIDAQGKVIVPLIYDDIRFNKDTIAISKSDKTSYKVKTGFTDKLGNILAPPKYDSITEFSDGLAEFKKGNSKGYIDLKGREKFNISYKYTFGFTDGLAYVSDYKGKSGFINKDGKVAIPLIFDNAQYHFSDGYTAVERNGKHGFIDKTGKPLLIKLEQ